MLGRAEEKSGARNGLASCRETTDWGTTRRSVPAEAAAGSVGAVSSGAGSIPAARNMSRLSDLAASETTASSARSASSPGSRTAVFARIVAIPSRRFSCSARRVWLPVCFPWTRACSSRTSSATTWNFVRTAGVTRRRSTAASTSRTARASTDMTSSEARTRRCFGEAVRRAPACRRPGRATNSSSERPARWPGHNCRTATRSRTVDVRQQSPERLLRDAAGPTELRETDTAEPTDRPLRPSAASRGGRRPPRGGVASTAASACGGESPPC